MNIFEGDKLPLVANVEQVCYIPLYINIVS